jgi:hypothetical protein
LSVNCGKDWQDDRAVAKLKDWILRKLGCDVVGVELTDEQLEDAIGDAQEFWMQMTGMLKSADLTVSEGDLEYPVALIGSDVDTVVDVYFDGYGDNIRDAFKWADVEVNPYQWTFGMSGGHFDIVQHRQYVEDAEKMLSADRDWMWDRTRRVLVLSPDYNSTRTVKVIYASRCFDFGFLTTYEWRYFREYALAQAMKTLSIIRTKFPEKVSATGSFSMDGETLWANAEAKEMQVVEQVRLMQRPTDIMTG